MLATKEPVKHCRRRRAAPHNDLVDRASQCTAPRVRGADAGADDGCEIAHRAHGPADRAVCKRGGDAPRRAPGRAPVTNRVAAQRNTSEPLCDHEGDGGGGARSRAVSDCQFATVRSSRFELDTRLNYPTVGGCHKTASQKAQKSVLPNLQVLGHGVERLMIIGTLLRHIAVTSYT